jgi:hypothetical protein
MKMAEQFVCQLQTLNTSKLSTVRNENTSFFVTSIVSGNNNYKKSRFKPVVLFFNFRLNQFFFSMSILLYRISNQLNQLNMSNTSTRRHIVVSPKNFDLLKNYGRACDSMNAAVTEVLRIASREGDPHRGIK